MRYNILDIGSASKNIDIFWMRFHDIVTLEHANPIEAIKGLSNGNVAVSGGPEHYEILIYKSDEIDKKLDFVDAIDTRGEQVW